MKIKKKITFNSLKLFVFFMYNMAYVLYMIGYISRWINLAILAFFLFLCIYQFLYEKKKVRVKTIFFHEFKIAMLIVITFLFVSLIIQAINGNFKSYVFNELLYNIIPPTLAFFWINTTEKENLTKYFYIFLIRAIMYFFLKNGVNLNIQNIMSISWDDSASSAFETPLAHDFLFLEIVFLYIKKTKIAAICMFLCLLSFKRISFILALLFFVAYFLFGKGKFVEKFMDDKVRKKTRILTFIVMFIAPFFLGWIISNDGIRFFGSKGIDINEFTSGRVALIRYVNSHIGFYNGYGSSNYFMKTSSINRLANLGTMHCDILRLYYEVTIIGLMIFIFGMIEIARRKKIIFLMLLYLFMELCSSHFLDVLSVWNMYFMFAAYVYLKDENTSECNTEGHDNTQKTKEVIRYG